MCLTGTVIRVLAKYYNPDLIDRSQLKSPEYLAPWRVNPLPGALLFMKKMEAAVFAATCAVFAQGFLNGEKKGREQ